MLLLVFEVEADSDEIHHAADDKQDQSADPYPCCKGIEEGGPV